MDGSMCCLWLTNCFSSILWLLWRLRALCFCVQVLGAHQVIPDATQTPARLLLPASRASETCPSVHPRSDCLLGRPLDPQIHLPSYHLPSNGECRSFCGLFLVMILLYSIGVEFHLGLNYTLRHWRSDVDKLRPNHWNK